jgi:beta-lactamase regulating signal transducer with metallopeptidase domain
MHTFWEIIVSNSLLATVLAVVLALLGRMWKNPVGLHLLWVMVLLKLVTPPLVILPVPWTVNRESPAPEQPEARQRIADRSSVEVASENENASVSLSGQGHRESDGGDISRRVAPIDVAPAVAGQQGLSWRTVLTWSWVVGIALFASGQACRILRLRRLLHGALPAPPTILRMTQEIGRQLGLSWTPEVLVASVRLSPMVWSLGGRPRLVLPAALFARLERTAQEAIVAHELAHIRRRDHWVRLLELTVSTLFWWHPVVWWACRVLRELEEHCCDGMVLGAVPHGGRAYATALVDTLDYLSERSLALPPVATGANSLGSLSRRIKMLKNPASVRPLPVGRLVLLLAVAAVPMAVAFAGRTSPADDHPRSGDPKQDQGQDSLVAQLGRDEGTGQPPVAKPSGTDSPAKHQKTENRQTETWRLPISLQASNLVPSAVQWAIFDKDPVPGFKSRFLKLQGIYQEQLKGTANEAAREEKRNGWLTVLWDSGFKEIPGDRLYLLTPDNPHSFMSNAPDGKKWIVTKVQKAKGKPVCWCIPVEAKYGEATKVALTDKNVFDLRAAAESALREPAALTPEDKKIEDFSRKTWRIRLNLRVPGSAPFEVPYAIFDEEPVPGFKASVKKWHTNRKADRPGHEALKGDERQAAITANWDVVFKKIPGNRLYQLKSSGSPVLTSNEPEGKKWIVTKVVEIKGKPACWCLPVEVKTGEMIKVTLAEDNVFDLGSVFDSALGETESKK